MNVEIITTTQPAGLRRYHQLFEACPDAFVQQSVLWANVIAELGPDRPYFLICNDGQRDIAGLPLYHYEHELGSILNSVPQAGPLGGVFCLPDLGSAQRGSAYDVLLKSALDLADELECLTISLITNPFMPDLDQYERSFNPDYIFENFTQYIDLESIFNGEEITSDAFRPQSNLSRNVRKALRFGFEVTSCNHEQQVEAWYQLHEQRQRSTGAPPLDKRLLLNILRELCPEDKAQIIFAEHDGTLANGGFYVYHRNVMDYYMSTFHPSYSNAAPGFLNIWHMLHWAHKRGVRIFNWQSCQDRASGVYQFKKQWGSLDVPYYYVTRMLCSPQRLQEIGREQLKQAYAGHYVVPLGVFEEGFTQKNFAKCTLSESTADSLNSRAGVK